MKSIESSDVWSANEKHELSYALERWMTRHTRLLIFAALLICLHNFVHVEWIQIVIEFLTGALLGLAIGSQIIYPIIYFFPKALVLKFKGQLKFIGVIRCFVAPVSWCLLLVMIGFFFPSIIESWFFNSLTTRLGANLAVFYLFFTLVDRKDRAELNMQFEWYVVRYRMKLDFKHHLATLYTLAETCMKNKQYVRAISIFKQASDIDPGNNLVHLGLGLCYVYTNLDNEAVKEYDILSRSDPDSALTLLKALKQKGIAI